MPYRHSSCVSWCGVVCVRVHVNVSTDILLLCDIFENFRNTAISTYGLDPCNYYTLPGLSWDALLKLSGARLELLYDIDQHQFIEHGMRGGVSMVTRRHARANNSRLPDYDSTKPTTYLQYLDANNLYGWAMCQPLPIADFKWEEVTPSLHVMVLAQPDDAPVGYIVECDMSVPPDLHYLFQDYPLAP